MNNQIDRRFWKQQPAHPSEDPNYFTTSTEEEENDAMGVVGVDEITYEEYCAAVGEG